MAAWLVELSCNKQDGSFTQYPPPTRSGALQEWRTEPRQQKETLREFLHPRSLVSEGTKVKGWSAGL